MVFDREIVIPGYLGVTVKSLHSGFFEIVHLYASSLL